MTRIAAVQLSPVVGDLAGNIARATEAIRDAVRDGAAIVVLPELTTSGYVFADRQEAERVAIRADDPVLARWAALLGDAVLVVGFAEAGEQGLLFNSAAVVDRSGTRAVYRKVHLWDLEKRVFTAGDRQPALVETPYGRVGLMICFDLEFPEWTRIAALQGADLLVVPANWPVQPGQAVGAVPEVQVAAATARLNHMAVVVADRQGTERGVEWAGGTHVVGADGAILAAVGRGDGVAWAEVDLPASRDKRQATLVDLLGDRRPDLYGPLLGRPEAQPAPTCADDDPGVAERRDDGQAAQEASRTDDEHLEPGAPSADPPSSAGRAPASTAPAAQPREGGRDQSA